MTLPRLYTITNTEIAGGINNLIETISKSCQAGLKFIQVREKKRSDRQKLKLSRQIRQKTPDSTTLMINGRPDIARICNLKGVHRPQSGLPLRIISERLTSNQIVGVSTHSKSEALHAQENGADFVTLSPIFRTKSKPGYGPPLGLKNLSDIASDLEIPVFALAGITPERTKKCIDAGAYGIAVMGNIMRASPPHNLVEEYLDIL